MGDQDLGRFIIHIVYIFSGLLRMSFFSSGNKASV